MTTLITRLADPSREIPFRSFCIHEGPHRVYRWEPNQLKLFERRHYDLETTDKSSDYDASGRSLKIYKNDSFSKAWTRLTTPAPPKIKLANNSITFGDLHVAMNKTLRIPNDGNTYPLPAGFGSFPLFNITNHDLPGEIKAKG